MRIVVTLAFVFFVIVVAWLISFYENIDAPEDKSDKGSASFPADSVEWPVIAESTFDYDIELLAEKLKASGIPVIAEIEHRSAVKYAILLLKNYLRVKPEYVAEARKIIEDCGLEKFLVK
ncbi:MAG: hypothetical protein ACLFN5_06140 [bacterium]